MSLNLSVVVEIIVVVDEIGVLGLFLPHPARFVKIKNVETNNKALVFLCLLFILKYISC